jgi:hypothetical protein
MTRAARIRALASRGLTHEAIRDTTGATSQAIYAALRHALAVKRGRPPSPRCEHCGQVMRRSLAPAKVQP